MRDYELMVVLDANLDEETVESTTKRITTLVTHRSGTVQNIDVWGRRRLAYPIGRHRDGIYILFRLSMGPEVAAEVENALKLTEVVLRHLIVRAEEIAPVAPAEPAAARA